MCMTVAYLNYFIINSDYEGPAAMGPMIAMPSLLYIGTFIFPECIIETIKY